MAIQNIPSSNSHHNMFNLVRPPDFQRQQVEQDRLSSQDHVALSMHKKSSMEHQFLHATIDGYNRRMRAAEKTTEPLKKKMEEIQAKQLALTLLAKHVENLQQTTCDLKKASHMPLKAQFNQKDSVDSMQCCLHPVLTDAKKQSLRDTSHNIQVMQLARKDRLHGVAFSGEGNASVGVSGTLYDLRCYSRHNANLAKNNGRTCCVVVCA